jgi:hypothetical protein
VRGGGGVVRFGVSSRVLFIVSWDHPQRDTSCFNNCATILLVWLYVWILRAKVSMWLYLPIYYHAKWHLSLDGFWAELDSWADLHIQVKT